MKWLNELMNRSEMNPHSPQKVFTAVYCRPLRNDQTNTYSYSTSDYHWNTPLLRRETLASVSNAGGLHSQSIRQPAALQSCNRRKQRRKPRVGVKRRDAGLSGFDHKQKLLFLQRRHKYLNRRVTDRTACFCPVNKYIQNVTRSERRWGSSSCGGWTQLPFCCCSTSSERKSPSVTPPQCPQASGWRHFQASKNIQNKE